MTDAAEPLFALDRVIKRFVKPLDMAAGIANLFGAGYRTQVTHAVDGVSFVAHDQEVVGLVGESGCGKSTVGRMVAGLIEPSEGRVLYRGQDVRTLPPPEAKAVALGLQMVFQDPFASLNPRMKVGDIIGQAPRLHGMVAPADIDSYVDGLLDRIGLDPGFKRRYPHQLSGGQRQRVCIARALAVKPKGLVCDEAVASLDVSIQAQIINLFMDLRENLGLTYLFITHDLGVVELLSDRIIIMYLGRIVETAPTAALFAGPNHPYAQGLLAEIPDMAVRRKTYVAIKGEIPSSIDRPSGCHFHPRCPHAMPRCREEVPALKEIAAGRWSACHLNDAL